MQPTKKPLPLLTKVANNTLMSATPRKWVSCSISWVPSELAEVKQFCVQCDIGFSEYIRLLIRKDRSRRQRHLKKSKE